MDFNELIRRATAVNVERELGAHASCGGVGAALLTEAGNVYLGVCIDTACGMGFCAEHAAAAAMLAAGENGVVKMVAVNRQGQPIPPCGRCREFISQLADANRSCAVMVNAETVVTLRDLLPYSWYDPQA